MKRFTSYETSPPFPGHLHLRNNPQMSLLHVVWPLIYGKHIVSVPHHDGLLQYRVDGILDEEMEWLLTAMRLKKVTLAALDKTREVNGYQNRCQS